ncbi:DUF2538 family protein [Paenibacillus tyrfis]|uniref:DUF2538 family protein n=1 Tax=Paenibacillus tyrfis TaxID=1501230 RepID=UPI000B58E680|nr:DUF2538 family protein [Paenibacillus tyrfis]
MSNIFFVNSDHKNNFRKLLVRFSATRDREYAVACYVLAHPEIFRKINWSRIVQPFDFLKWRGHNAVDLSNGFRLLVDAARNLFNYNNKFNLMDALSTWDQKSIAVFHSAMDIRMGRVSLINAVTGP